MRKAPTLLLFTPLLLLPAGCGADDPEGELDPWAYVIQLTEGGDRTVRGTVSLPPGTPAGHLIQVSVNRLSDPIYFSVEGAGNTTGAEVWYYRMTNATDGEYKLRVRVDLNDSGQFDSGDLEGYYDGTVAAPIQESSAAAVVTLAGGDLEGIDFGVGPSP